MVWATKNHRTLLLGNPFTLETDHNALKYLLADKFEASVGRLARWSLMIVKYRRGPTLGAADFMSRIWENPDGSFMVGAVQPGMVEGEEPPGITRTRVNVILEKSKPEAEPSPFLCSRDFELAQANCPWVTAIHAFVKSKGREVPTNKSWAPCANGLKPTRTISRPIKGFCLDAPTVLLERAS